MSNVQMSQSLHSMLYGSNNCFAFKWGETEKMHLERTLSYLHFSTVLGILTIEIRQENIQNSQKTLMALNKKGCVIENSVDYILIHHGKYLIFW